MSNFLDNYYLDDALYFNIPTQTFHKNALLPGYVRFLNKNITISQELRLKLTEIHDVNQEVISL